MTGSKLLAALAAALEAGDWETLVTLYADHFRFEDIPLGEAITTRSALRAYFQALFARPGAKFTDIEAFSCGDRGAARWTWSGRTAANRPFAIRGASLFELGEKGITRETIHYDPSPALNG